MDSVLRLDLVLLRAHSLPLFRKLTRLLRDVPRRPAAEPVHQLRTTIRRVEAVLETMPDGRFGKLRKQLRALRRRAGRVRNLDVQLLLLKSVRLDGHPEQKDAVARKLAARRARREKKLLIRLDEKAASIRKRLARVQGALSESSVPEAAAMQDPVGAALDQFVELGSRAASLTADSLHDFRTECKRTRYLAEMAGDEPDAALVVRELKRVQDAIGAWHDWSELLRCAEEVLAGHPHALLIGVLRTATSARFAHSLRTVAEVRDSLLAVRSARGRRAPRSVRGASALSSTTSAAV